MQTIKDDVFVKSFHFDRVTADSDSAQSINISLQPITDPAGLPEKFTVNQGKVFQIVAPFSVCPEKSTFLVSGEVSQIIQLVDFTGEFEEIDPKTLTKLSRPCIEYIETLTYQVTSVTLNEGVQLMFTAQMDQEEA